MMAPKGIDMSIEVAKLILVASSYLACAPIIAQQTATKVRQMCQSALFNKCHLQLNMNPDTHPCQQSWLSCPVPSEGTAPPTYLELFHRLLTTQVDDHPNIKIKLL